MVNGIDIVFCRIGFCACFVFKPKQIVCRYLEEYGKADKVQMQRVVASHLRLNNIPRPDDAADALGVALCHAFTSRFANLFGIK